MEKGSFKSAFLIVLFLVSYDGVQFGVEARGPVVRYPCNESAPCPSFCSCVENWCKCPPAKILKFIPQDISAHPQAQKEMP
ncbi:unnamed protein product [Prunus armeniaca]